MAFRLDAVLNVEVRESLPTLDQSGIVAYTDGACIKNPGGLAGWSALLWAAVDADNGKVREGAPRLEVYGHIPSTTLLVSPRTKHWDLIGLQEPEEEILEEPEEHLSMHERQ